MLNMKKATAFVLALIMAFSCMPVSLAGDGNDQITDTVQNKDVVLVTKGEPEQEPEQEPVAEPEQEPEQEAEPEKDPEEEPEQEPARAELLELSPEDISVSQLSDERLEALKSLIPDKQSTPTRNGAKRLMKAAQPVTNTYTGFAAFEIAPNSPADAEKYDVDVRLNNSIVLLEEEDTVIDSVTFELYHIHTDEQNNTLVETITEGDGLDVSWKNDRITGFSFSTTDFSEFVLKYTVVFHYGDKEYACDLPGAKDIPVADIFTGLEVVSKEETASFAQSIANVEVSNEEAFRLSFDEDGWKLRILKETGEPETLTVTLQNGRKYILTVSATGNTELATEDNSTRIGTVNDYYLPEEAGIYSEVLTGEQESAAIAAVQDPEAGEETVYQVYSIGLDNVDEKEYEGFNVRVSLDEWVSGKDFRLYRVEDGASTDITNTLELSARTRREHQEVAGFSFTTDSFAEYVLCYTLVTYYTTADGDTYRIELKYGPEAGIPENAGLNIGEILPEDEAYETYLQQAAQAAGIQDSSNPYARFFDIEIHAEGQKIEPKAFVSVSISLADLPETAEGIKVVHFGQDGPVTMDAEVTADAGIQFETDSFSVYGVIVAPDWNGRHFMISHEERYVKPSVLNNSPKQLDKSSSVQDAALWQFESAGQSGRYYLSTTVNGQKMYMHMSRMNGDSADTTLESYPQAFTVTQSSDGTYYTFSTALDGTTFWLNEWYGNSQGNGFAGYASEVGDTHLTVTFTEAAPQYVSQPGESYAVIVQKPGTEEYYLVQNDGSLVAADYNTEDNTVKLDYPVLWKYTSAHDGIADDGKSHEDDIYLGNEPYNIRIAADARGYNWAQLADGYYYRYISPVSDSGIDEESEENDHGTHKWLNGLRYTDNRVYGITWDNDHFNTTGYIGADFDNLHLKGNQSADNSVPVYFAKVVSVPDVGSNHESVSHIDIAIKGQAHLDVPLAYGTYYDENHNPVLVVTKENNVTLKLEEKVSFNKEDIMKATVRAYDKEGTELNDAFYITGYSANAQTGHSTVQVRMEGSFKVDTLGEWTPHDGIATSNQDTEWMSRRRDNQVYYRVSTSKEVSFDFVYKHTVDGVEVSTQLYDEQGRKLTTSATVGMSAGFSYWDLANECPPVQDDFEKDYSYITGDHPVGYNNSKWLAGAIIDGSADIPGDSGMDFVLGQKDGSENQITAIEIVKIIEDEDGNRIYPSKNLISDFKLYYKSEKDSSAIHNLAVSPDSITETDLRNGEVLIGYRALRNEEAIVGSNGMGATYDYDVKEGMFYIIEDSTALTGDGKNVTIIDTNETKWVYIETRVETEYVWRDNEYNNKRHVAEGYTAVPEILGDYTDDKGASRRNQFLEFYVYNVYTNRGSLKIRKNLTVDGTAAGSLADGRKGLADGVYTFTIASTTLDPAVSRTLVITFADGAITTATLDGNSVTPDNEGWITVDELPADTYTVTEADPGNGTSLATGIDNPQNVVVSAGDTEGVKTAQFTNNINTTSLTVSKTVVSPFPADSDTTNGKTFTFTVRVTKPDESLLTGTFGDYTFNASGETTVTTTGTESKTIPNLPQGAEYTVTEATDNDFELTSSSDTSGTLEATASTAAFTNTRKTGSLKVNKSLAGKGTDAAPTGIYTYPIKVTTQIGDDTYYVVYNDEKNQYELTTTVTTLNVTNGTTLTINNLPLTQNGTALTYTVEEDQPGSVAVTGFTWVNVSGTTVASITKITPSASAVANLVNVYERDKGKLSITKTVTVNGETVANTTLADDVYSFTVNSDAGVTPATTKNFTITLTGGVITSVSGDAVLTAGKAVVSDLPTGSYTVTENLTDDQIAKGISFTKTPDTSVLVNKYTEDSTIESRAFVNNITVGSLKVTKSIQSTSGETISDTPSYPITITVTLNNKLYYVQNAEGALGATAPATSLAVTAGTDLVISNLPYGTYSVNEKEPWSVAITGYSYVNTTDSRPNGSTTVGATEQTVGLVNVYAKGASWTPQVGKLLNDTGYTGNAFSFTATMSSSDGTTESTDPSTYYQTVTSAADGTVSFPQIQFSTDNVGEFKYKITENQETDSNVSYDTETIIYAKVTVTNENNVLKADGNYFEDEACTKPLSVPVFKNYELGNLDVTKTVSGSYTPTTTDVYPFTVKKGDKFVEATISGDTYTYSGLSDTDPGYTIPANKTLHFEKLPVGTYIVTEGTVEKTGYKITKSYKVGGTTTSLGTANVEKGETAPVEIENHYRDAKLVITKTISGVTPATAAGHITIKVTDNHNHELLNTFLTDDDVFTLSETTYTATLKSTDSADYAQYIVPDGIYTVTETVTDVNNYVLKSSTYTVTAKVSTTQTETVSGTGYQLQLTDGDTSTGTIAFTNTYETPTPPHKEETAPYTGTGELGGVKVGDNITYKISYKNYKTQAATVKIVDLLDEYVAFVSASNNGAENVNHKVEWTLTNVAAGAEGYVTLTVKVLEGALKSNEGPGKVVNGGDTATVQVGNDAAYKLEVVENPVPEVPHKQETEPYEGTGVLGGVKVGDIITYELSYENYKSEKATITVKDILDEHVELVSDGTTTDYQYDSASHTVTWILENVEAGYKGIVTLKVKVLASALTPGKVINEGATVKVGEDHEFTLETVENPVPEEPHKKETSPYTGTGTLGAVQVGDRITYRIDYKNYKSEAATVTIVDQLDPNVRLMWTSNDGTENDIHQVIWTLTNVAAGAEGYVTLNVLVLEGALVSKDGPGKVVNGGETATVQVGNDHAFTLELVENPVPEEPHKTETAPYEGSGVLGGVKVGDNITYKISYKNYKTEAAKVVIKDKLDDHVAFVGASNGGKANSGIVTWTLNSVPAGQEGFVTLTVKVLEGALVSNGGTGSVVNGGETTTVKVGNDSEFSVETVENPVEEEPHKKETGATHNGTPLNGNYEGIGTLDPVRVGDEITYEITYTNYKTTTATVTIKDKLDGKVEYVSSSPKGTLADGVVTWTIAGVEAGKSGSVALTVTVLEGALLSEGGAGKVVNGPGSTVQIDDDHEFTLETVENPVTEPHKKETDPYVGNGVLGGVRVGDVITYQISYENYKSDAATVVIKDKLDPNVELVTDGTTEGYTYTESTRTLTWTLTEVAPKATGTITLKVKVLEGALTPGKVVNEGATVKVGEDHEIALETVENPVTEPHKREIDPYVGTGVLGGVRVGDVITYEISYENYKDKPATVTIKDKLDPNVEYVTSSDSGKLADGVVIWTLTDVPAGEKGTVTLQVKVLEGALVSNGGTGSVVNGGKTATVQVGNDTEFTLETVENPVTEPHKKEIDPYEGNGVLGPVRVGDEITYEISYENYKADAATVVIRDKLDVNVEYVSSGDSGKLADGVVTWTLADVPAGTKGTVTLTVKVLESALVSAGGPGKVINNGETATVKVGNDNEFTLETVENPVPEPPHKKETAPYEGNGVLGGVQVGDEITYEISYRNYKTEAATVTIKDKLDANVEYVSSSDSGKLADGVVIWTLANVAAGKEGKVTLTVKVLEGALKSNEGPGKVVNGGKTATVQVGNDSEYELETVENPVTEPHKKETAPYEGNGVLGGVRVGDEITYEINYENYKAEAATIVIKDKLDKNVEYVSSGDSGKLADGVVTWTLADVPAGKKGTVTLTVKVLEGALVSAGGPGKVINNGETATVKVGNDNEFTLETVENPVPEPHKKETGPYEGNGVLGPVKVDDEITYEISYENYKGEAATVVIRDKLDVNVEYVSSSDSGKLADGTVVWTLADVPAGKKGTVTLTVKVLESALVSAGGPGKVINNGETATVKVGNDKEFTLETVENPVEETEKEEPHKKETAPYEGNGVLGSVMVGEEITYEISYRNYKLEAADVVIKDKLDANVEFISADNEGKLSGGTVTWTLKNVPAGEAGKVTLTVKVLESALVTKGGPGKVVNGGETATVKIGNDDEFTLETVENPVDEQPHKRETSPYAGNGTLGGVSVGEGITYEITYTNYKAEKANVIIRDQLDPNVGYLFASNGGAYDQETHTVTWTLTEVPAGQSGSVTLIVKVRESVLVSKEGPGEVVNGGETSTVQIGNDHEITLETVKNPVPVTSVTVKKVWNDADNAAGLRPAVLKVTLSNGSSYYLNEGNKWTVTVTDLPKYEKGKLIEYSWKEQSVPGYTRSVKVEGNVTTFTNSCAVTNHPKRPMKPLFELDDMPTPLGLDRCINHVGDNFD